MSPALFAPLTKAARARGMAHLELKSAHEEIKRLQDQLGEARDEQAKLVLAIGDHVTVRGEYYARALAAEERARKAEEQTQRVYEHLDQSGISIIKLHARATAAEAKLAEVEKGLVQARAWWSMWKKRSVVAYRHAGNLEAKLAEAREALGVSLERTACAKACVDGGDGPCSQCTMGFWTAKEREDTATSFIAALRAETTEGAKP